MSSFILSTDEMKHNLMEVGLEVTSASKKQKTITGTSPKLEYFNVIYQFGYYLMEICFTNLLKRKHQLISTKVGIII